MTHRSSTKLFAEVRTMSSESAEQLLASPSIWSDSIMDVGLIGVRRPTSNETGGLGGVHWTTSYTSPLDLSSDSESDSFSWRAPRFPSPKCVPAESKAIFHLRVHQHEQENGIKHIVNAETFCHVLVSYFCVPYLRERRYDMQLVSIKGESKLAITMLGLLRDPSYAYNWSAFALFMYLNRPRCVLLQGPDDLGSSQLYLRDRRHATLERPQRSRARRCARVAPRCELRVRLFHGRVDRAQR